MRRLLLSFLLLLLTLGQSALCALPGPNGSHATDVGCQDCHPGTTSEEKFSGVTKDCDACHNPVRNIHPINIIPKRKLPTGFALSGEGKMLCRTCHKVHGGDKTHGYLTDAGNGYEKGRSTFCASCHGSENVRTNPHSARRGDSRCEFCHTRVPQSSKDGAGSIRTEVIKLCDFCHGAVAKNHPKNVDPSLTIPPELPLGPNGKWSCVTCHDPHGTTTTTHYVRIPFARFMERGKSENPHRADYFACKACHNESTEKSIRIPGFSLRYKGDINILCISCHVTDRGHHPTEVDLPAAMLKQAEKSPTILPLDEEGRITCYTCHDNQCDTGIFKMVERDYDSTRYKTDLCWNCHNREEYAKVSPHVEDYKRCTRCHETNPVRGLDVSLMAVPLMVCLHCHEVKPHPVGKSHIAKPTSIIRVDKSLPLSKEGKVVCVTCHNPHEDPKGYPKRLRVATPKELCGMCHWRG